MRTIRRMPADAFDANGESSAESRAALTEEPARLSRGNKVTLGVFFALLVVLVVGSLVHLPYAIATPGPVVNTLGSQDENGKQVPLIVVDGLPTYPTNGTLDFTTVRLEGGPGYPVDVWDVLGAWFDGSRDIRAVDEVFDTGATQQQIAEQDALQMEGSQQEATAVALRAIGQKVPTFVEVAGFTDASQAKKTLQARDRLKKVGTVSVSQRSDVLDGLRAVKPGEPIDLVVARAGKDVEVRVTTIEGQQARAALGVYLGLTHDFPAKIAINPGAVGGPSAGLMFSLGIYDRLTPGALTGNHQIAGTGTLADDGTVGPIGFIKQKMAGAKHDGAQFFLAPAQNCDEVVGNIPDGLQVFKVGSFDDGRAAVEGIAAGRTSALPHC